MKTDNTDRQTLVMTPKGRRLAELLQQDLSMKEAHEIVTREFGYFAGKTPGRVN